MALTIDGWVPTRGTGFEYFEVPVPSGDAVCSDPECPCADEVIPHGGGYVYISQSVVEFRRDASSIEAASAKLDRLAGGRPVVFGPGIAAPILACRRGAELKHLDLEVAAEDARHWWETGMVPLRPTPLAQPPQPAPVPATPPAPPPVASPPQPPVPSEPRPDVAPTFQMPANVFPTQLGIRAKAPGKRRLVWLRIAVVLVFGGILWAVVRVQDAHRTAVPEPKPRVAAAQSLTPADAVLDGRWKVDLRLTSARGFQHVHEGRTLSPVWTLVAHCSDGRCKGATLEGTSPGGSWSMKLERRGDTYVGRTKTTMSYCGDAPLGASYNTGNAVKHTLTLKLEITDAEEIDGEWLVTAFDAFLKDRAGPATGDTLFGKVTCPASGYTATVSGQPV